MIVELTLRSIKRGKERLNLSPRSLWRTAQKAFESGLHHEMTHGSLREWCFEKINISQDQTALFILGHQAFVFQRHFLITVLLVPHHILPRPPKLRLRPEEDFEDEDLEEDEIPGDIRKLA